MYLVKVVDMLVGRESVHLNLVICTMSPSILINNILVMYEFNFLPLRRMGKSASTVCIGWELLKKFKYLELTSIQFLKSFV